MSDRHPTDAAREALARAQDEVCRAAMFFRLRHDDKELGLQAGDLLACDSHMQPIGVLRRIRPDVAARIEARYRSAIQDCRGNGRPPIE